MIASSYGTPLSVCRCCPSRKPLSDVKKIYVLEGSGVPERRHDLCHHLIDGLQSTEAVTISLVDRVDIGLSERGGVLNVFGFIAHILLIE